MFDFTGYVFLVNERKGCCMARPNKSKCVSRMPRFLQFLPAGKEGENRGSKIILNVEEYEALRLLDYEGMTQEECAACMDVGRATIQALYTEARKKMARFLVEGACLQIVGGNYRLAEPDNGAWKGKRLMKIAVTYENGQIFGHFGHTEQFKLYETEEGKIISSELVDTNGTGHGALAGFLKEHGVLICGNIGGGARNALAEAGIRLFPGAAGKADAQVESFLAGSLSYDPAAMCHHHGEGHVCKDHGHHGEGHGCGGHGRHGEDHGCGGHVHHGEGHGCKGSCRPKEA